MADFSTPLHIGIAGAGLAGRSLAWRLARAGCKVSLFDARKRGDLATASQTAAAMLSPLAELAVSDDEVFELGMRSMLLWPKWIGELASEGGAKSVYFRQQGTLVVAHTPDKASLEQFSRQLHHKLPAAMRPGRNCAVCAARCCGCTAWAWSCNGRSA